MSEMNLQQMADSAVTLIRQAMPWVAQTAAAAAVTKGVEELWDSVKRKLSSPGGQEALDKATATPEKERNWETVRDMLLDALEEDEAFRERVGALVEGVRGGVAVQMVTGDGHRVGFIQGSPGAKITF